MILRRDDSVHDGGRRLTNSNHDFGPTASIETLRRRAAILRRVRQFFDERGFFEVETPLISSDTVVDRYIEPIPIPKNSVTGSEADASERLWLQTSPEFAMKRLLAGGADAIYQICKAFRQNESGDRHNPEFTMLEWYRVGDDYEAGMDLLSEFVESVLELPKCEKITYSDAFKKIANVDPFRDSVSELVRTLQQTGVNTQLEVNESNRDGFLNVILSELVEPKLGVEGPVIVFDFPASQSALSIVREGEFPVAERFELYIDGIELANGYHELIDPKELNRRNAINNQLRRDDGSSDLPEESRLLQAMEHRLPPCAGVAMGIDRLVMAALRLSSLSKVIAFPFDRA